MSRIKNRDTKPELIVRSVLHRNGYRFRINRKDLPGKPDIVLPSLRKIIFIHGCFWHRHEGCRYAYNPKTRVDFWQKKFIRNVERDQEVQDVLLKLGWETYVIWECETKNEVELGFAMERVLGCAMVFETGQCTNSLTNT